MTGTHLPSARARSRQGKGVGGVGRGTRVRTASIQQPGGLGRSHKLSQPVSVGQNDDEDESTLLEGPS